MAGALTYGFDYECDNANGGVLQGSILIAQWENITAYTKTAGVITSLTQAGATSFFRYQLKKEIADVITTETHDPLTGTNVLESVMNAMLNQLSASKNVQLELLVQKPLVIIYDDNNGKHFAMGLSNGAEKVGGTNTGQTGKALNDHNGYALGFTSREKFYPPEIDASTYSGLTISAELS